MAQNLRAKLPPTDTLLVYDLRVEATESFAAVTRESSGATVEVLHSTKQLAERSVSDQSLVTFQYPKFL